MMGTTVVIVNYNTRGLLRSCLSSVLAEIPAEVIVVDNASTDDSCTVIRNEFPAIPVLRNNENMGYGAAANRAVACCTSPYVLLLNSDTLLQPGTLKELACYLDRNPHVAIAGPKLVGVDRRLQPSCFPFPTPLDILLDASNLTRLARFVPVLKDRYLRSWCHDRSRRVPWVAGAALAIRREAFEAVGGFDESFFMYYEEVDLCYRLTHSGWQIHYTPSAEIIHIGSASTQLHRAEMIVQFYSSLAHFYQRHYSWWRLAQLTLLIKCIVFARLVRDKVLLSATKDLHRRTRLAENITAWRRLLIEEWWGRTATESHCG